MITKLRESFAFTSLEMVQKLNECINDINELNSQSPMIMAVPLTPAVQTALDLYKVVYTPLPVRIIK